MASDVTKSCRDIEELEPNTRKLCKAFLEICKGKGLNVFITETYRPQARQNFLYAQGRTRPGKIVTWTNKSFHTTRRAFDFARADKGRTYDDSDGFFKKCAEVARKLGLNAGYFWTDFQDKPHIQLDYGKTGASDKEIAMILQSLGKGATNSSSENKIALKGHLMAKYNFSSETADFILAFEYGEELARKLLNKEEISAMARDYILSHQFGSEILRRVYG